MRVVAAIIAVLAIAAGVGIWSLSRAAEATGRSLLDIASNIVASTRLNEEHLDAWSPIVLGGDTVGKLIAVARLDYGDKTRDSVLIYRGLLTRPPTYPADSLAAIDSTDDPRFAHELRLIPLRATNPRHRLGTLQFENTNVGIPVMAARVVSRP